MDKKLPLKLILEDGTVFTGYSFGYPGPAAGEVVFNTAMTGYPESLTDPSYKGQILVVTYPLVGNYGVPDMVRNNGLADDFESDNIQVSGLVISDYSVEYSHWSARKSLGQWLNENKIPGIFGIDTRALTKIIREKGAMLGKIITDVHDIDFYNPNQVNLVSQVSIPEKIIYGSGKYRIALIDCGVKNNIIRCLLKRDTTVMRLPWNHDLSAEDFDGLMISNGPGDPKQCGQTIENIQGVMAKEQVIFGICLGNQLLALASGADTYKLKYGHRSHNQPVLQCGTNRCFITSQNHGFAIDNSSLGEDWEPLFVNVNDQTNEGIKHKHKPFFSAQFHPEASSGPTDTEFLFDDFIDLVRKQTGK
ncbi:MAG: glutamine-hydrolyzing carbamoyl-phosphate synthase small subunit [Bacteroidales bacterium]